MTPCFAPVGTWSFHKTLLGPGEYFARIARPICAYPSTAPDRYLGAKRDADAIAGARGQLTALMQQLDRICQTHSAESGQNGGVRTRLRKLLILDCTEVESHWRGVLAINGIIRDHYSTKDMSRSGEPCVARAGCVPLLHDGRTEDVGSRKCF